MSQLHRQLTEQVKKPQWTRLIIAEGRRQRAEGKDLILKSFSV
jgi:hypothetical protein